MEKIGILTLGQTPRPDLVKIFRVHLPTVQFLVTGGLDNLSLYEIDQLASAGGEYPLLTILRDGSTREISLLKIKPLLEQTAREVAAAGAKVAVLMCTGDFPDIESPVRILYAGRILSGVVGAVSRGKRIGVVTPTSGQISAASHHWKKLGFEPKITVAAPANVTSLYQAVVELDDPELDLIVLDCMGFSPDQAKFIRPICKKPVLCPQGILPPLVAEVLGL